MNLGIIRAGSLGTALGERLGHAQGARVVGALPPFASAIAARVRDIGAHPVDAVPLTVARYVEPAMMLLVSLAYAGVPPRSRPAVAGAVNTTEE